AASLLIASSRPTFNTRPMGLNGAANSAILLADDKVVAGGVFSSVNSRGSLSNITRSNPTGSLDTTNYDVSGVGAHPVAPGPAVNGGFSGAVTKVFNTNAGIVAVGTFTDYNSILYERSTIESPYIDKIKISQIARLNTDGEIDSSF